MRRGAPEALGRASPRRYDRARAVKTTQPRTSPFPPPSGTVRVVFSLFLLLLAPFSWWWSIDDPHLRASGATAWACLTGALFLAVTAAWRDRRRWVRVVLLFELTCAALALWAFFVFARMPEAAPPERAPDFTLPDQEGRPVTLARELTAGPVLLVFFRGRW